MQVRTISVKDMLPFQRPREKFVALGAKQMAMEELLAILLRTGLKGQSSIDLAHTIIDSFTDGIYGLNHMTVDDLVKIKGVGIDKAVTICAAVELGRRLGELKITSTYEDFSQPYFIAQYVMERLRHETEEHVLDMVSM